MRTQSCVNRGFTLVELLVVIGIIASLISILLPALSRARQAAQTVVCASGMRQLGQAMAAYSLDHSGYLPLGGIRNGTFELSWDDLLHSYLGKSYTAGHLQWSPPAAQLNQLLKCGSDTMPPVSWASAEYRRSYAMTDLTDWWATGQPRVGSAERAIVAIGTWPGYTLPAAHYSLKWAAIRDSANFLLLVESHHPNNIIGNTSGAAISGPELQLPPGNITVGSTIQLPHNNRFNYLFADGHVSALHWTETVGLPPRNASIYPQGAWTISPND